MQDLISFLHADGLLTRGECSAIKGAARNLQENPVRILRSLNIAAPADIQRCFKVYFNYPMVTDTLVASLTSDYAALMPVDLALHYSVFAFGQDTNKLHIGMEDPTDRVTLEALKFFLNRDLQPAAANVYQLCSALEKLYGVSESQSGVETILDRARGSGAWSLHEKALFEKMLEERRLREQEDLRTTNSPASHRKSPSPTAATDQTLGANGTSLGRPDHEETISKVRASGTDDIETEDGGLDDDEWSASGSPALTAADDSSAESFEDLLEAAASDSDIPPFDEDDFGFETGDETASPVADPNPFPDTSSGFEEATLTPSNDLMDLTETESFEADTTPEALPTIPHLTLSGLAQKALIKVSMANSGNHAIAIANAIFEHLQVVFFVDEDGTVAVNAAGQNVTEAHLETLPWSVLAPLARSLGKKSQSKAS